AVRGPLLRGAVIVPAAFGSDGLVSSILSAHSLLSARVLWPRAEAADERLAHAVRGAGAVLDAPVAYRTQCVSEGARELVRLEQDGALDALTFTAPSALDCYAAALTGGTRCVVAVIGGTTASAARARGIPVQVEPRQPIITALVAALAHHYSEMPG